MSQGQSAKLIVGLGNPGTRYENTRHNVGFRVVKLLASKMKLTFHKTPSLSCEIAKSNLAILALPLTYVNSSGEAVRLSVNAFGAALENLLVVTDDIALPFGKMRLRSEGTHGGHNGLRSIEEHLGTKGYPRLRVGVGDRLDGNLEDHVLGQFNDEEKEKLPEIFQRAAQVVETFINDGIEAAIKTINKV